MTNEIWKTVERNAKYEVSSLGRVRSFADFQGAATGDPKILKPDMSSKGYPRVALSDRQKISRAFIHTLVAEAFIGPMPEGACLVRHKDGDPANPRWDNLEYGTHKDNESDKLRHGTRTWGEKCHLSKLTEEQVIAIRAEAGSNAAIAKRYGVTRQLIWQIRTYRIWKWIQN